MPLTNINKIRKYMVKQHLNIFGQAILDTNMIEQCLKLDRVVQTLLDKNFDGISRIGFAILYQQYDLAQLLIAHGYKMDIITLTFILNFNKDEHELMDIVKLIFEKDALRSNAKSEYDFQYFVNYCKTHPKFIGVVKLILKDSPKISPLLLKEIVQISKEKTEFMELINDEYIQQKLYMYGALESYHDPVSSLIAQTNIPFTRRKEVLEHEYSKLLHKHPILYDILYIISLKKDSRIMFLKNVDAECGGEAGCFRPKSDISYCIYKQDFNAGIFIHESAHKFFHHILGEHTPYPQSNTKQRDLFKNIVRQVLYNFAVECGIDYSNMDQMSTWEIGKKILSLKEHCNIDDSLKYTYNTFLNIYRYDEAKQYFDLFKTISALSKNNLLSVIEDAEFIVRLPQIIATDQYNEKVQKILKPLEEYWMTTIKQYSNTHLSLLDQSNICIPAPQSLPQFVVYSKDYWIQKLEAILRNSETRIESNPDNLLSKLVTLVKSVIGNNYLGQKSKATVEDDKSKIEVHSKLLGELTKFVRSIIKNELQDYPDFVDVMIYHKQYEVAKHLVNQDFRVSSCAFKKLIEHIEDEPTFFDLAMSALDKELVNLHSDNYDLVASALDHRQYKIARLLVDKGADISQNALKAIIYCISDDLKKYYILDLDKQYNVAKLLIEKSTKVSPAVFKEIIFIHRVEVMENIKNDSNFFDLATLLLNKKFENVSHAYFHDFVKFTLDHKDYKLIEGLYEHGDQIIINNRFEIAVTTVADRSLDNKHYDIVQVFIDKKAKISPSTFEKIIEHIEDDSTLFSLVELALDHKLVNLNDCAHDFVTFAIGHNQYKLADLFVQNGAKTSPDIVKKIITIMDADNPNDQNTNELDDNTYNENNIELSGDEQAPDTDIMALV